MLLFSLEVFHILYKNGVKSSGTANLQFLNKSFKYGSETPIISATFFCVNSALSRMNFTLSTVPSPTLETFASCSLVFNF